ncbi:MAG: methylisocitrate lyase [Deltaproteobacteria bacterium]|nr:methylisocitrate lyase [Deltaproteobacteria bacterium]
MIFAPGQCLKAVVKILPGVFNPLAAMAAKQAGFKALYLSGGALSASLGKPDIGLIAFEELVRTARAIVEATHLPLLVDADTGYAEVSHCVKSLEKAGAFGLHIEDQLFPKRCGHLEGKELVPTEAMCEKIRAACRARKSKNFLIMARTDARGVEGLEAAIKRARAYVKAGAGGLFPEGLTSAEEFKTFAKAFHGTPLLANMTEFGKTPLIDADQFAKMGYAMVIFPVTLLRLAMKAIEEGLKEIKTKGTQQDLIEKMQTRKELYKLLDYKPNAQ